ncbi:geranyl-diphosphate synthase [Tribonema minus]|uniref:Geranyl-diphosphate synthase n=1 Tax=Tribonema minus TaxID=303371 RepID=A0A836CLR5_9STRA|nr:geranyl-diphosphate synthase [Tribonema minus]
MRSAVTCSTRTAVRRCCRHVTQRGQQRCEAHRSWAEQIPAAGACRSSSFLADAVRDSVKEALTSRSINHIINGEASKPASLVDVPTLQSCDDFVYDIDLERQPSGKFAAALEARLPDPFRLVASDMKTLSDGCKELLGTDHPVLQSAAQYFFDVDGGKKVRPVMVLLMSRACNASCAPPPAPFALACQRRLAEITEMIHTASLFHDDVIDKADTRRGAPSANRAFGNKLAILAGDFLLARASVSLSRLRSVETVELLSTVIEHLVKGEVLQMRPHVDGAGTRAFEYYVHKTYYKTGSLMANSCQAAALLGGSPAAVQRDAHEYGKRVGLAFQLIDDVLDFEGSDASLGKPALNDLKEGLATAPVLLAAEEHPALLDMVARKFGRDGDAAAAHELVLRSDGIARARDLAIVQAELAMDAATRLAPSEERDALVALAARVVDRRR